MKAVSSSKLSAAVAVASAIFAAPVIITTTASADILVGQCLAGAACTTAVTPTPWSDALNLADLTGLGLGNSVPFVAEQTGIGFMRLGVTTMTFSTSGSPVTESLSQFNGNQQPPPCIAPCQIATVGSFSIPSNATSAVISGTFGNSVVPTSAAVDLFVVPGPIVGAGLPGLIAALGGLVAMARRRRKQLA